MNDKIRIPVLWINLARAKRLKKCMEWALAEGSWTNHRFDAIDAGQIKHRFIPLPNKHKTGNVFPGALRSGEPDSARKTTRPELACLASWQHAIDSAFALMDNYKTRHVLIMEDDVGSSLAVPEAWPFSLTELTKAADRVAQKRGIPWSLLQLAPINAKTREALRKKWDQNDPESWLVPKEETRSHGNGAVLVNKNAFEFLSGKFRAIINTIIPKLHLLTYPRNIRPVADKWIYASVPQGSVYVLTYPLFCLEARDSELHHDHVENFHRPSREITLQIWKADGYTSLLDAYKKWEQIT
jgi:GR25 family glycosyltransferase involved in LPS biosynthesis